MEAISLLVGVFGACNLHAMAQESFQNCTYTWSGTSPFCGGKPSDCTGKTPPQEFVRYDKSGDGHTCLTGQKVLCEECPPSHEFLATWMQNLMPAIGHQSILNLSLPGTHDSMTYDLSDTVSDNANDLPSTVSWILHELEPIVGAVGAGDFIREQAQTQGLSMKAQLEAGIRFVDFRIIQTAAPDAPSTATKDWYCLHLVESNRKSMVYLQQAKDFLDSHPEEVLVFWLSRHGSECSKGNDQYPNVSIADKQAFWTEIKSLFGGLLFNTSTASPDKKPLNETSISELVSRGQRMIVYAADHAEFTGGDSLAFDACESLGNDLHGGDLDDLPSAVTSWDDVFKAAPAAQIDSLSKNRLNLVSFAGSPPSKQLEDAAIIKYDLGIDREATKKDCASIFNIPNMTDWCPTSLLDCEQLRSYYLQFAMDKAVNDDQAGFPGAIYLDAVDLQGTIRTGTTLLSQQVGQSPDADNTQRFGYVDSLLLYNVRKSCSSLTQAQQQADCAAFEKMLVSRRNQNPAQKLNNPSQGRHSAWP